MRKAEKQTSCLGKDSKYLDISSASEDVCEGGDKSRRCI
jgi:hypothetical protein